MINGTDHVNVIKKDFYGQLIPLNLVMITLGTWIIIWWRTETQKKNIKSLDFLKNFKVNTVRTRQMELQVGFDTVVVHHPNFCTKKK